MVWGNARDLEKAVKRLHHFVPLFEPDGPFTAITPFGRNLALFHDFGDDKPDFKGRLVLCAGAGSILADKCDHYRIEESPEIQDEISAWWWRANAFCDLEILFGLKHGRI